MNKTIRRVLFTLGAALIPLTLSSDLENQFMPQNSLENMVKIAIPPKKMNFVSIELGNPTDQEAFVKNLSGQYPAADICTKRSFDLPVSSSAEDSTQVYQLASENTRQLVDQLGKAQIIHLSGHHYVNGSLLFGGKLIDSITNKYDITSAINLEQLPVNDSTRVTFLLSCFGVDNFNDVTVKLSQKFPNSVLLGYRLSSAPGTANARCLDNFFRLTGDRDLLKISKRELAKFWIQAGQKTFNDSRDISAVWKEDSILYELRRFNKEPQKRYLF